MASKQSPRGGRKGFVRGLISFAFRTEVDNQFQTKVVDNKQVGICQTTQVTGPEQYSPSNGFSVTGRVTAKIPEVILSFKFNMSGRRKIIFRATSVD